MPKRIMPTIKAIRNFLRIPFSYFCQCITAKRTESGRQAANWRSALLCPAAGETHRLLTRTGGPVSFHSIRSGGQSFIEKNRCQSVEKYVCIRSVTEKSCPTSGKFMTVPFSDRCVGEDMDNLRTERLSNSVVLEVAKGVVAQRKIYYDRMLRVWRPA